MTWCGKRSFTPACKRFDVELKDAVRLLPGRIFLCVLKRLQFFRGFSRKRLFCRGVFVVKLWWIAW